MKSDSVLTPGEKIFYPALRKALQSESVFILSKVRFADLLYLPPQTKNYFSFLHQITSKHVDFVLCEPDSLKIILVIELDDSSHQRKENSERDTFKNDVLRQVGIPILRIPTKKFYSVEELRQKIKPYL